MKKIVISGAIAALLSVPAMAQNASSASVDELRKTVERLEAEVDYLKENAKADRKDLANKTVTLDTLNTTVSKYTWSGDFRYRHEEIDTEGNVTNRDRDRIRLRFGVLAKVNDTINAKIQLSTTSVGGDNARSTNQTLGNGTAGSGPWDRKALSIDQAYVEWKPISAINVTLGKMPIPWVTTASYFWDKDLTPEGGVVKFTKGVWFGDVAYNPLSEQDAGNNTLGVARSTDSTLISAQFGIRQPIGKTTLTAALGYFEVHHVQDMPVTVAGTGCTTYAAANPVFAGSSYGNSTYTVGTAPNTCAQLLSGFSLLEAQAQLDFNAGKFPMSVFVDYLQNQDAVAANSTLGKLDSALSAGVTFNKASAAKSWEVGVVYQKTEKDSQFGQFVDSDFSGGVTDAEGYAVKAAFVPATNWTLNGTYFINQRFNDVPATNGTITTAKTDHDYKRLQLDLNYKF